MPELTNGFDWADGLGGRIGTPNSDGGVTTDGGGGSRVIPCNEMPDSPEIERAEQATLTHRFDTDWTDACTRIVALSRGTILKDSAGNITKILSAKIQRQKGNHATLTVTAEGLSFDTPPDEFSIKPVEMGVNIIKHPRYFYALTPSNLIPSGLNVLGAADTPQEMEAKQAILRCIQGYQDSPVNPIQKNLYTILQGMFHSAVVSTFQLKKFQYLKLNPNYNHALTETATLGVGATPAAATVDGQPNPKMILVGFDGTSSASVNIALAAAQEVISKIWRQEDTPYMVGFEITWSAYYFRPVWLNPGGYVENPYHISGSSAPTATPELPDYFYSTSYPPDPANTIFDFLTIYNPQCYSSTGISGGAAAISWLRKADDVDYQRTWFKYTRNWIGAPIGIWDQDINSQHNRPTTVGEYNVIQYS